jgi:hypothetical protein
MKIIRTSGEGCAIEPDLPVFANAVAVESCARPLQLTAEGAAAEEPRAEAAAAAADDGEEDIIIATS